MRLRRGENSFRRQSSVAVESCGADCASKQGRHGFSANTLCQYFHWLYRQVGIDGASSHSGGRSFITNLASKGVGVRVLMSLAGHRDISTTQRYIDVNDEMQRKAVDLV